MGAKFLPVRVWKLCSLDTSGTNARNPQRLVVRAATRIRAVPRSGVASGPGRGGVHAARVTRYRAEIPTVVEAQGVHVALDRTMRHRGTSTDQTHQICTEHRMIGRQAFCDAGGEVGSA
jgi:hypothetical protein